MVLWCGVVLLKDRQVTDSGNDAQFNKKCHHWRHVKQLDTSKFRAVVVVFVRFVASICVSFFVLCVCLCYLLSASTCRSLFVHLFEIHTSTSLSFCRFSTCVLTRVVTASCGF